VFPGFSLAGAGIEIRPPFFQSTCYSTDLLKHPGAGVRIKNRMIIFKTGAFIPSPAGAAVLFLKKTGQIKFVFPKTEFLEQL
jgi:hypothetical protein